MVVREQGQKSGDITQVIELAGDGATRRFQIPQTPKLCSFGDNQSSRVNQGLAV